VKKARRYSLCSEKGSAKLCIAKSYQLLKRFALPTIQLTTYHHVE
jgi:hypothetical protein